MKLAKEVVMNFGSDYYQKDLEITLHATIQKVMDENGDEETVETCFYYSELSPKQ